MSRKDERKKKDAGKRQRILTYVCAALIALVVLLSAYIAFSLRESQRAQEQGEATANCIMPRRRRKRKRWLRQKRRLRLRQRLCQRRRLRRLPRQRKRLLA